MKTDFIILPVLLFFKISLIQHFVASYDFYNCFSSSLESVIGISVEITLNLSVILDTVDMSINFHDCVTFCFFHRCVLILCIDVLCSSLRIFIGILYFV